jgi:hypothetical protein
MLLEKDMITRRGLLSGAAAFAMAPAARAQETPSPFLDVTIENKSAKEGCAEIDSVHLALRSARARKFRIEAAHPPYISSLRNDEARAMWSDCGRLPRLAEFPAEPRQITFWETANARLTGVVQPSFWRKPSVPVRVGDRVEHGLHYVQYWMRHHDHLHDEVLVFYPADGNWRAKPLPPEHMRSTAYGSSFMIGPVEYAADNLSEARRPFVDIAEIVCFPEGDAPMFRVNFRAGGHAEVRFSKAMTRCEEISAAPCVDDERILVFVEFSQPIADRPFAALNSMYATRTRNDVSWLSWRDPSGKWVERDLSNSATPVPERFAAKTLWAGRDAPSSRHNVSSPDMAFDRFEG